MTHKIYVTRDIRGLGQPETARLIKSAVEAALRAEKVMCRCRVDVLLTDDKRMQSINFDQRGVDSTTDVLSFPANELKAGEFSDMDCEHDPDTGTVFLGDMVISVPRCQEQGKEFGHGYQREVSYLVVHSTLHLLGYDHMDDGDEKKLMRSREEAIMDKLGLKR